MRLLSRYQPLVGGAGLRGEITGMGHPTAGEFTDLVNLLTVLRNIWGDLGAAAA